MAQNWVGACLPKNIHGLLAWRGGGSNSEYLIQTCYSGGSRLTF